MGKNMEYIKKLKAFYGENEPILIEEIRDTFSTYSKPRVAQIIAKMTEEKQIIRFENGLYYIPTDTIFGKSKLNIQKVAEKKYIKNSKDIYGFYTSVVFAKKLDITMQIPNIVEIYTNKETTRVRNVMIGNQTVKVRKARIEINRNNYKALQLLELLNQLSAQQAVDYGKNILNYIEEQKINIQQLIRYSRNYPAKTIKNLALTGAIYGTIRR